MRVGGGEEAVMMLEEVFLVKMVCLEGDKREGGQDYINFIIENIEFS